MSRKGKIRAHQKQENTCSQIFGKRSPRRGGFVFVIQSGLHAANNASLKVGGEPAFCPVGKSLLRSSESGEAEIACFRSFREKRGGNNSSHTFDTFGHMPSRHERDIQVCYFFFSRSVLCPRSESRGFHFKLHFRVGRGEAVSSRELFPFPETGKRVAPRFRRSSREQIFGRVIKPYLMAFAAMKALSANAGSVAFIGKKEKRSEKQRERERETFSQQGRPGGKKS